MATTYVIFRYGSHAANQPLCHKAPVGIYEANTRAEALSLACRDGHEGRFTVYNNQMLEAVPKSKVSRGEFDAATEDDIRENTLLEPSAVGCCLCGAHPRQPMVAWKAQSWCCEAHTG